MLESLTFERATHTYRIAGRAIPSVTDVTSLLDDFSGIQPSILEAARQFGQHVHQACHLFDLDELDWGSLDLSLVPYVEAWKSFLDESGAIVLASEEPIYNEKLGYAGTPDRILQWGKRLILPDLKATAVIPRTVGPQTAGYAKAYHSMYGREPERYCLHLLPGKYRAKPLKNPSDWSVFLSALNCWRFRNAT